MTTGNERIFIGLGSNLGDSMAILREAWDKIGELPGVTCVALSSPYVAAPVDMHSQHWFTNAVGELHATVEPFELLCQFLALEEALGRTRDTQAFSYQDRLLDLDILYVGDTILNTPELTLPHPHIAKRLFVLTPLAEIAPDFRDCKNGRTIRDLEERLRARIASGQVRRQEISRARWEQE